MMTISFGRSAMTPAKTLEGPLCHPKLKNTIWTTSRRSYNKSRCAMIGRYKHPGLHWRRNGIVPILSLPALHFQICDIQLGPYHHRCSNGKSQRSTYSTWLTLYLPRRSGFPRLVETRAFLNQKLVEITTFLNTKWLPLLKRNGSWRQLY